MILSDEISMEDLEEVFHDAYDFIPSNSIKIPSNLMAAIMNSKEEEKTNSSGTRLTLQQRLTQRYQVKNESDQLEEENKTEDDEPEQREMLPYLSDPKVKISIWTIIKDSIGKDLSKMSVPVYFNDPTNLL